MKPKEWDKCPVGTAFWWKWDRWYDLFVKISNKEMLKNVIIIIIIMVIILRCLIVIGIMVHATLLY